MSHLLNKNTKGTSFILYFRKITNKNIKRNTRWLSTNPCRVLFLRFLIKITSSESSQIWHLNRLDCSFTPCMACMYASWQTPCTYVKIRWSWFSSPNLPLRLSVYINSTDDHCPKRWGLLLKIHDTSICMSDIEQLGNPCKSEEAMPGTEFTGLKLICDWSTIHTVKLQSWKNLSYPKINPLAININEKVR